MAGVFLTFFLTAVVAQDVKLTPDGPFWVETESGTMPAAPVVRITALGAVVVHGGAVDQVQYTVIRRVRARSKEDAGVKFGHSAGGKAVNDRIATLIVAPPPLASVMTRVEVTVPRSVSVEVNSRLGDIEAGDLDGNVRAGTTAGQIRCDRIRGWVEGNTGGGEVHMGKIGGAVHCVSAAGSIVIDSAGGEANCQTMGGEIQIHEAAGPLTLSTEGGNIEVDRAGGNVDAHTGQGVIEIAQALGTVFADTRGGSIQVGSARGVRCQSAQGTIRVKTVSGPLDLQTAMGSILAELLAGARIENASLVASGDITVMIPSNLALSLVARNDTGANPRVVSDFSELRPRTIQVTRPQLVYEGSINGGGPVMTINTGSGIIYVRKLK